MEFEDVTFEVVKDIYWDDWGRPALAFSKGQICKGKLYINGVVSAESPYHSGVSDMVDLESIKIITK